MKSHRRAGYLGVGLALLALLEPSIHSNIPVLEDIIPDSAAVSLEPHSSIADVDAADWARLSSDFSPEMHTNNSVDNLMLLDDAINPLLSGTTLFTRSLEQGTNLPTNSLAGLAKSIPLGAAMSAESHLQHALEDALTQADHTEIDSELSHNAYTAQTHDPHHHDHAVEVIPDNGSFGDVFIFP